MPDNFQNPRVSFPSGPACIYYDDPLRLAGSDCQVSASNPDKKGPAFLLKAVLIGFPVSISAGTCVVAAPGAFHAGGNIGLHQNRQIRFQISAQDPVQLQHRPAAEFATTALIGFRRVGEAVAEHHAAFGERGLNDFCNVLRARGEHQSQLSQRGQAGGPSVEQNVSDFFSHGGSTRLARNHHGKVMGSQHIGELFQLRALAATIQAFHSDELSAMSMRWQERIIAFGSRQNRIKDQTHEGQSLICSSGLACLLLYSLPLIDSYSSAIKGSVFMIVLARRVSGLVCLLIVLSSLLLAANPPHIILSLDATQAPRKIFHARMTIPASPGTLTLYYPKWIPGEHGPTGPIEELTGLKFTANGQILKWRRDLLDGWTIHVEVPAGAASVEASLDFASPPTAGGKYTAGPSATDKLAIINWNTMLLYPAGWKSDELIYEASLRLPAGWKFGTALPIAIANRRAAQQSTANHV